MRQVLVLNLITDSHGFSLGLLEMLLQKDLERGRFDCFSDVDDFLQTGNTERHIHGSNTGTMESIERHLSGRLSHGLSTDATNHLTWVHNCTLEDFFN